MKIDITDKGVKSGNLYTQTIPNGSKIIGTVELDTGEKGAFVVLENGATVQVNAGIVRNLPAIISIMSTADLAEECGLSQKRIQQLANDLIDAGHGKRVGKPAVFFQSAIDWVKKREDGRRV